MQIFVVDAILRNVKNPKDVLMSNIFLLFANNNKQHFLSFLNRYVCLFISLTRIMLLHQVGKFLRIFLRFLLSRQTNSHAKIVIVLIEQRGQRHLLSKTLKLLSE